MNVAIYGASDKPSRYSYKALLMLKQRGHRVFPIHPTHENIEGEKVYKSLAEVSEPIHTVTMYIRPEKQRAIEDDLLGSKPQRVVFNPGTENLGLVEKLEEAGIATLEACTLVLLSTNAWE